MAKVTLGLSRPSATTVRPQQGPAAASTRFPRRPIHSGHFMVSEFEAEAEDDEDNIALPVQADFLEKKQTKKATIAATRSNSVVDDQGKERQMLNVEQKEIVVTFDEKLEKLFRCMTIAYEKKLVCPKWNRFKGLKLRWKDKIRLNNIIWRAWHMQFIKRVPVRVCQFEPADQDIHTKPEAVVLEGKYWKRNSHSVTAEYKRWRLFYKHRAAQLRQSAFQASMMDSTDLFHGFLWPPEWDRGEKVKTTRDDSMLLGYSDGSGLLDDDLFMDFNDTLFNSLIPNQPYAFPNPREIAREAGLAEFMQPGLVALQTNLDDFMDTLEPLQDLLSSRLPLASVPEEDQASIHLSEVGSHPPTTSVAPPAPISPQAMSTASPAPITTVPSPQMQMHPLYSDASGGRGASSLVSPCHPGEGVSSPYLDLDHHKYMAQEQHPPMISPLPPPVTLPALSGRVSKRFPPQGGKGLGGKVSASSSVPVGGGKSLESLFSMTTPSVTQSQEAKQATPISVVHHTRGNRRSGVSSAPSASPKKSSANSFPIQLSQEPQDNAVSNAVDVKPSLTAYQQLTSPVSTVASANVSVGRRSRGSGDIHRRSSQGSIDSLQLGVIVHPRTRSEDQDFVMPEMAPRNRGRNNSSPIPNALLGGTGSSGNMAPLVQLSTVRHANSYGSIPGNMIGTSISDPALTHYVQDVAPSEQKPAFGRFPSVPPSAQQQAYYRSTHAPTSSHYSPSKEPHRTTSVPSSPLTTMSSPTSPLDGVASPSMLSGVGSPLSQKGDTREHRRVTHINAEHKRRCHIKNGFELLHALVPKLNLNPNSKVSKAGMLEKGAEYISQLKEERKTVEEEMENLKREIKELTADINECQAHLPDTGAPVSSTRNSRINDLFEKYVREQTRRDWKFWVFAQLMSPMVESFGRSVSTTSLDDLCRSTLSWSEQHCALVDLRKSVTSSLCHLGVSTSILSDPSRLAIEAVARGGSGPCDLSMSSPTSGFSSVTSSTSSSASPGSSTPTLYRSRR